MKVTGFLPSAPLSRHNGWGRAESQGRPKCSRCRLSMVTAVRWERVVASKTKRDVRVSLATGDTSGEVIEFFQKYSAEEKTLVERRASEIEQWIQDEEVLIAQKNGNCIGVARVLNLDRISDSSDPIVDDFNLGSITPWHEGRCEERSGLMHMTTNNVGAKVAVDRSASMYISSFCMHREFRRTGATLLLIDAILNSVRKSLRASHAKLQNGGEYAARASGLLFGTAVNDRDMWKLACKCMQKEVKHVYGKEFSASYLTFQTSYPNGSPARGNFVYFLPPDGGLNEH